ncbi:anti-phage protein KwaB [Histophilus somni]|uniref:anti-phage protein KwaB n=1 Tax=Histophilus somni TaxID=731 RepID=UPI00201E88CC|nr:anti-phage protein KwaB [Histophilus somni]
MTLDSLKDELKLYKENEIGICVYAILKENLYNPMRLDIESKSLNNLTSLFLTEIRDTIINRDDLYLMKISSSDERKNAIYEYDLDIPKELSTLDFVLENDNIGLFNLKNHDFGEIKSLIIEIGNNERQVVLYKTMAPVNIFSSKHFFIKKHKSRLEKIKDDFLRITPDFQMIKVNGRLLVINLQTLERNFGFHDIIKKEAVSGCSAIKSINILSNPEVLIELIEDVKYARKLTKIAKGSPVLSAKIPNKQIIEFCKIYPSLRNKFRFNEDKEQIILDTKVSKDLFIKVLMDDFLTSELTKYNYVSLAKDNLSDSMDEQTTE